MLAQVPIIITAIIINIAAVVGVLILDVVVLGSTDFDNAGSGGKKWMRPSVCPAAKCVCIQASDPRFINASVEFDLATLKPTYRLLWGEGGLSNALAVAQGLGFDPKVVQRAREIAVKGQVSHPVLTSHGAFQSGGFLPRTRWLYHNVSPYINFCSAVNCSSS